MNFSKLRELTIIRDPKRYAATRTIESRNRFWHLFTYLDYSELSKRRRLAKSLEDPIQKVPEDKGFLKIDCLDRSLIQGVMEEGRQALQDADLVELKAASPGVHLINIPIEERIKYGSPILNFALNPRLLSIVSDYLGMLPVMQGIYLFYSPNRENIAQTSQYFHLDGQDIKMVKVWVYIEDVDEDNGPLTIVSAKESARLARALKYRKDGEQKRIRDEVAYTVIDPTISVHQLTGEAGSVFLVDTDRCFHFGSRQSRRTRCVMGFYYFSPFAFVLPRQWKGSVPFSSIGGKERLNEVERHVLGAA